jgi:hypothetical protein
MKLRNWLLVAVSIVISGCPAVVLASELNSLDKNHSVASLAFADSGSDRQLEAAIEAIQAGTINVRKTVDDGAASGVDRLRNRSRNELAPRLHRLSRDSKDHEQILILGGPEAFAM